LTKLLSRDRDHQDVTEGLGLLEVHDVAGMDQVEATVAMDDNLAGLAQAGAERGGVGVGDDLVLRTNRGRARTAAGRLGRFGEMVLSAGMRKISWLVDVVGRLEPDLVEMLVDQAMDSRTPCSRVHGVLPAEVLLGIGAVELVGGILPRAVGRDLRDLVEIASIIRQIISTSSRIETKRAVER